ncbi:hypothetical protein [Thalassotalea sp. PS06]|uniref:hypothetical protein n=1 Tax=Thalassotalea sp. PS06 TaxID=2594005 RepID=UPI001163ADFC|nr:hypothetical protein [Thalassotalea sp. PS06]QDP00031.1 hypothetical protein FNC98_00925 [Thalassotalea sp. PS06]
MTQPLKSVTMPSGIFSRAGIYLALLLSCLVFFVATSSWLYQQLAQRAEYLQEQQIPFIKNNAKLLNKLTELEYHLSQQQLAIAHQQFNQPLDDLRDSWSDIVTLTKSHMVWLQDQVRKDQAGDIQRQSQNFVADYNQFSLLVDELLLVRQARNGQYQANIRTLSDIINRVEELRNRQQLALDKQSTAFVSVNNRVNTQLINDQIKAVEEVEFYQYLYQQLLLVQVRMSNLSSSLGDNNFNDVAADVAQRASLISQHLKKGPEDKAFSRVSGDIAELINQFIGSGQLFAKWRDEAQASKLVTNRLGNYQKFLTQTATLVSSKQFFDLPEFSLTVPLVNITVSESMMLPTGFLMMVILLTLSALLAWRMLVLVKRSYFQGAEHGFDMAKNSLQPQSGGDSAIFDKEKVASVMAMETKPEILANELALIEQQAMDDAQALESRAEPAVIRSLPEVKPEPESIPEPVLSSERNPQVIMDMEKFNHYHATTEMAATMLDDYLERNRTNLQRLQTAFEVNNLLLVAKINEAILQTAKILFAPRLIRVCQILRQYCHEKEFDNAQSLMPAIEQAMDEINAHAERSL